MIVSNVIENSAQCVRYFLFQCYNMEESVVFVMLIRRQLDVLMHLINSTDPLSGNHLAELFHVNVRTIRTDIKKINEFLKEYQIQIQASNQFGYRMDKEDIRKFHQKDILHIIQSDEGFEVPQTPNERISYLFFLLTDGIGYEIEELADLLYISIASIYNDLHIVKRFIEKRFKGLSLMNEQGKFYLHGHESAKRNLLSGIVSQRYHHLLEQKYSEYINPSGDFLDTMYKIIKYMTLHKEAFNFHFTGEGLYSFASDISLCVEREKQGSLLVYDQFERSTSFLKLQSSLCTQIQELGVLNEMNWCYLQDRFYRKNFIKKDDQKETEVCCDLINEIRTSIKEKFHINVLADDKSCEYMMSFLSFFLANEEKAYYWNEDDKYEIMLQHSVSYMLSLYVSFLLFQRYGTHLNTTYLSKCALVFEESFLRNEMKKKGVLITNKDKEHIQCLLHKLVKHFGNAIDILEYGTSYDVIYGNIDINSYDTIISTEALTHLDQKGYIKISSVCTANDIMKVSEYLEQINEIRSHHHYDIKIVHFHHENNHLKEYLLAFIHSCKGIKILNEDVWNKWDLEESFFIKNEQNTLLIMSAFLQAEQTIVYQLIPKTSIHYKKKEFTDIKLWIINEEDFPKLDVLICNE